VYQQQQQQQQQSQAQEQDAENPFFDPPLSRIKIIMHFYPFASAVTTAMSA
jgi:hypothetical protein